MSVNEVENGFTIDSFGKFSPVQRKYIKIILKDFIELFKRRWSLKNCEVITHFPEPLRPVQIKGRRVPIHVLEKVLEEETIKGLLQDGKIVSFGNCADNCFYLTYGFNGKTRQFGKSSFHFLVE